MSERPWMPLNVDDYMADTLHLSAAEHGAYLLLIMRYWKDGGLPDDDRMVQRFSRLSNEQWAESRDVLASFFEPGWKHKRIDAEIEKAAGIIEKRRSAALSKHAKSKEDASAVQVQCTSSDTRVPHRTNNISSSLRSDESYPRRAKPEIILQAVLDPMNAKSYANHLGRKLTPEMAELLVETLREVQRLGGNPAEAVKLAIRKGWASLDIEYLRNAGFKFLVSAQEEAIDWQARLAAWRSDGTWASGWGPPPNAKGCRAPPELIGKAA